MLWGNSLVMKEGGFYFVVIDGGICGCFVVKWEYGVKVVELEDEVL